MDATCKIQGSIHVFRLVHKYVSRILGTYQFLSRRPYHIKVKNQSNRKYYFHNGIMHFIIAYFKTAAMLFA